MFGRFTPLLISSLLIICFSSRAQSDAEWYESFFQKIKVSTAEEALAQAVSKLEQARISNDKPEQAHASKELGLVYLTRLYNYERAMDLFIRALTIEDSLNLSRERIFTLLAMSEVFKEVGDYAKGQSLLEQAWKHVQEVGSTVERILVLNELGAIHARQDRPDEALSYYTAVLSYKNEAPSLHYEAAALSNMAHLYQRQGKYEEAFASFKESLALYRTIRERSLEAEVLNDIGTLYWLRNNPERALANHVAALEIRQSLDDRRGIAESYVSIGVLYHQQNKIDRAIANLKLGLQAARESQTHDQIRKAFEYLSACYRAQKDFKLALDYREEWVTINEFIEKEKAEQSVLEKQNRYVVENKEAEIDKLETIRKQREEEIETQKRVRNSLILVIVFGVVIVLLIIYLYWQKQRSNRELQRVNERVRDQNKQLQDLNATKDKFFSIISHDLKGPLNSLTSFSGLLINHIDNLSKEEIQMLAKDLDKSLKNLFALLENLLEWSRSQTGNIDFTAESFDIGQVLEENRQLLSAQAGQKQIVINVEHSTNMIVYAHKHSITTVVRNLISNAIKFTPVGGTITLSAQDVSGGIRVSVKDSGVGMSQEVLAKLFRLDTKHTTKGTGEEKGTGLGLILCKDFVEKNGGTIGVMSEEKKGSEFFFSIPKKKFSN